MLWIEVAKQRHMRILSWTKEKGMPPGGGQEYKRGNGMERKQILHFTSFISLMYFVYDWKTKERFVE